MTGRYGDTVRAMAAKFGWQLAKRTIIVEGEHDEKYFRLAAHLYQRSTGRKLINQNFGVQAAGSGSEGGTLGILDKFPSIVNMASKYDCNPSGKPVFRFVALLDNDQMGRKACDHLIKTHAYLEKNRDVFLLRRVYPQVKTNAANLENELNRSNSAWSQLDCEIEDLLHFDLVERFRAQNGNCMRREPTFASGACHWEFTDAGKSALCRWVNSPAAQCVEEEMGRLISILQCLRFYMNLDHLGDIE